MSTDHATVARARRAAYRLLHGLTILKEVLETPSPSCLISGLLRWALLYEQENPDGEEAIATIRPALVRRRSSIVTAGDDLVAACASMLLVYLTEDVRIDLLVPWVFEPLRRCVAVIPPSCLAWEYSMTVQALEAIDDEVCRLLGEEVPVCLLHEFGEETPRPIEWETTPELDAALPRLAEPVLHLASIWQPRAKEVIDSLKYLRHVNTDRISAQLELEYAGLEAPQREGDASSPVFPTEESGGEVSSPARPVDGSISRVNGADRIWLRGTPLRLTPMLRRLLSHILMNPGVHEDELLRLMGWETPSHLHRNLSDLRKRLKSELRETGWAFHFGSEKKRLCWKWREQPRTAPE